MPPPKTTSTTATLAKPAFDLQIQTPQDLMQIATILYHGGAKDLPGLGRPEAVAIVIMAGAELGFRPAQSIGTIMLLNGKPSIYGDGAMAKVLASGLLEEISEFIEGDGEDMVAKAVVKRQGLSKETWTYSVEEAKKADLWGNKKKENWTKYPKDMLTNRCRSRWMKGRFADVLRGIDLYEVAVDDSPVQVVQVLAPAVAATLPKVEVPAVAAEEPKQLTAGQVGQVDGAGAVLDATTTTVPTTATDPNGSVTHDQLVEIRHIKQMFENSLNENSPTIRGGRWLALVQAHGVDTVRDLTCAQAAKFIEVEGPKYDPFKYPSTGSQT